MAAAAVTAQLAAYCASLDFAALPPAVQERTRFLVLDLAGNILRGRHDAESTPALLAAARALGLAAGNAAVLGDSARYTPAGAALLNGALAHCLDFDDTHAAGTLHPGAPVIPAALAAAEMAGADGRTVLSAIVAGYEVTCRLALALPGGDHYDRGYHPTATCGAFGGAAAAARVFGLSAKGLEDAFGIALSQSAGSLQFLANGAWTKRFQVGWSAMAGLAAAILAREGFRGAAEAFEGKAGFLRAYAPNPVPERALQELGTAWELMNTAVKPYPSCRYGHACIDAAIALRAEHGLQAGGDRARHHGPAEQGHAPGRRAARLQAEPAERRGRPVQRPLRRGLRPRHRPHGLGQLRAARTTRPSAPCCRASTAWRIRRSRRCSRPTWRAS